MQNKESEKLNLNTLHIPKRCPMSLTQMTRGDETYFCKSCTTNVIDFRDKTNEEILAALKNNTKACGIFNSEQLHAQKTMSTLGRVAFYGLLFLSFMGVSVKRTAAQTVTNKPYTIEAEKPEPKQAKTGEPKEKEVKKKRRRR